MHNLLKYTLIFSNKAVSLWFYSKDEANNFNANIANTNSFKSFQYKTKGLQQLQNGILQNSAITVTLKYLSNFW